MLFRLGSYTSKGPVDVTYIAHCSFFADRFIHFSKAAYHDVVFQAEHMVWLPGQVEGITITL